MHSKNFPKKIWFLWLQGENNMPEIVRICYESWYKLNKTWEIIFLNGNNINEFVDIQHILKICRNKISVQALSDIVRINLLNKYGGVWVDATCYCNKPLDTWLEEVLFSGFFAFHRPGKDRMVSSWFLAAKPENYLVEVYCNHTNAFWLNNRSIRPIDSLTEKLIRKSRLGILLFKKPYLWHSFFIVKILKQYHYYWFHYLFEKLYRTNKDFRNIWDQTPKIPADIPHGLLTYGLNRPISKKLKDEIDDNFAPVYKLTWRLSYTPYIIDSTYNYLYKTHITRSKNY